MTQQNQREMIMNTNAKIIQIVDFDEAEKSALVVNETDRHVEQSVLLKNARVRVVDSDDITTVPSLKLTIAGKPSERLSHLVDGKSVDICYTYWFRIDSENNWKSKYSPVIEIIAGLTEATQNMYFAAHPTETWSTYSRFFDTIRYG